MPRESSANADAAAYQRMVASCGVAKPYRATNDHIAAERERFDRAQALIKEGRLEEARSVAWWPRNFDPPKKHWSRIPIAPCFCGKKSPDGIYALCGYCKGTTPQTPSLLVS